MQVVKNCRCSMVVGGNKYMLLAFYKLLTISKIHNMEELASLSAQKK